MTAGSAQSGRGERIIPLASAYDLDELVERAGNSRVVMLGEASHGTHEFYIWRTALTKRLITEKVFHL